MMEWRVAGKYRFLSSPDLERLGVTHGFIGATGDFSDRALSGEMPQFLETFGVHSLFLPQQIHGATILTGGETSSLDSRDGDGVFIPKGKGKRQAFGVRTADCLPIIITGSGGIALVHAGWRGLANGIIGEALKRFGNDESLAVAIGPAAGAATYEVGQEVIDAIGGSAVALKHRDAYLLDLTTTAKNIFSSCSVNISSFSTSTICTICDTAFHSFRRQREARGSNLAFVII